MNDNLLKTSTKPEHNNMTDSNNNINNSSSSNQNKYKAYLIEKLLNESSKSKSKETSNELKLNGESNLKKCAESKEDDVASETGTYTIDEANDIANAADFNEDLQHRQANENDKHTAEPKNTNSTTNELVNARAAINEVFGVVQRPKIDPIEAQSNGDDTRKANIKRQPSKTSRTRNQTYSLSKDLQESQDADSKTANQTAASTNDHVNNSTYSTSSSSISSCSVDNHTNRLKKTMTYEVISQLAQNGEQCDKTSLELDNDKQTVQTSMNTSLNLASARTVGTELLLGDTEKLIEQLRKSKRNAGSPTKNNNGDHSF